MTSAIERQTISKVTRRLIPFLGLLYFVSFLDRVNVGFAAITMNKALGLTATAFGFGTGIFFLGYLLFEVPSNLALKRFGAKKWIARIMLTWGLISGAMAFIQGEWSFYIVRFLLGVAEAGFFPGIILYLTFWYPATYRAKIIGLFMVAIPISGVIGSPISGLLFGLNGIWGLADWQWMFLVEALPAIILAFVTLAYLPDGPRDATWLTQPERDWLLRMLENEERHRASIHRTTLAKTLSDPKVWLLGLVYFGPVVGLYGIGFWMPQIVKGFGFNDPVTIGLLAAIPPACGVVAMILWSRHSDAVRERVWHVAIPSALGGIGFVMSAYLSSPMLGMASLSIAAIGIYAALPVFWTLPTAFLSGAAAAGGIALVNSVGNAGGYLGPQIIGLVKDQTGSIVAALLTIAVLMGLSAVLALMLGHNSRLEQIPEASAAE